MHPRAKTPEEVRAEFLNKLRVITRHWSASVGLTDLEKCEGVAFSILNIFDGTSSGLPAMDIMLAPHHSDKEYCVSQGQDWYEPGMVINRCTLHDMLHEKDCNS